MFVSVLILLSLALVLIGYALAGWAAQTLPAHYNTVSGFGDLLRWARAYIRRNGWRSASTFPGWDRLVPGLVGLGLMMLSMMLAALAWGRLIAGWL